MSDENAIRERLLKPFRDSGESRVFVAECCGRLYVGLQPAAQCRTCDKEPVSTKVDLGREVGDGNS